jgi:hypothetical protein
MPIFWKTLNNNIHTLVISDAFQITIYHKEQYAVATGVDCHISLNHCTSLADQKATAQKVVAVVLQDIHDMILAAID